ncbi:MAG: hypothetical protein AAFV95_04125 [Bacteroidota bacterium]
MKHTKRLFSIAMLLAVMCACEGPEREKIQKTWISKYSIDSFEEDNEKTGSPSLSIVAKLGETQLTLKSLSSNASDGGNDRIVKDYTVQDRQLLVGKENLFLQALSEDSLVVSVQSNSTEKFVFEALQKHRQGSREGEFSRLLTSERFALQSDSIQIEFRDDGTYLSDDLFFGAGGRQLWGVDQFDGELFLVLNEDLLTTSFHILDFSSSGIRTKVYGRQNKEVMFKVLDGSKGFARSSILGEWEREGHSIPPPPVEEGAIFYQTELVNISTTALQRCEAFRCDTTAWEWNRGNDILIFTNPAKMAGQRQWNILSLDEERLLIERKRKFAPSSGQRIETVAFKRKAN